VTRVNHDTDRFCANTVVASKGEDCGRSHSLLALSYMEINVVVAVWGLFGIEL